MKVSVGWVGGESLWCGDRGEWFKQCAWWPSCPRPPSQHSTSQQGIRNYAQTPNNRQKNDNKLGIMTNLSKGAAAQNPLHLRQDGPAGEVPLSSSGHSSRTAIGQPCTQRHA